MPPLPSLAEFPEEEGDKELGLEQGRERERKYVSEKQLFRAWNIVLKEGKWL